MNSNIVSFNFGLYFDCLILYKVHKLFQLEISKGAGIHPINANKKKIPDTVIKSLVINPSTGSIGPLYNTRINAATVDTTSTIATILIKLSSALYFPIAKITTQTINKMTIVHSPR